MNGQSPDRLLVGHDCGADERANARQPFFRGMIRVDGVELDDGDACSRLVVLESIVSPVDPENEPREVAVGKLLCAPGSLTMPEPITRGERYMPGLDGLRAIAVLAVIFFHLGFGWAPGGLLGVGIFFTLSGYLITDILLGQFTRRGPIHLGRFWLGRARRLLPALFLMLLIVIAWVTIFGPAQPDQFRKAVVSAIFYVNNWQQIAANVSYFARFAPEQPLNHLWSLSVEEQFYIFWPLPPADRR